jgi:hypothetical protein
MTQIPNIEVCDQEFYDGFNGKFDFSGGGERFRLAFEWLINETNPRAIMHKVSACIAFSEKPRDFLITGKTKSMKGDGNGVNETILDLLPKHAPEWYNDLASGTSEERIAYRVRSGWPDAVRLLNMSMVKTVSLMWMECVYKSKSIYPICKAETQWMALYGAAPSLVIYTLENAKGNKTTHKIKEEEFESFKKAKGHWQDLIDSLSSRRQQVIEKLASVSHPGPGSGSSLQASESNVKQNPKDPPADASRKK